MEGESQTRRVEDRSVPAHGMSFGLPLQFLRAFLVAEVSAGDLVDDVGVGVEEHRARSHLDPAIWRFVLADDDARSRVCAQVAHLHIVAARYDVPRADLDKITHENAMRWYSYDPFAHVPKEEATVAALRTKAAGHDVSIRSFDKGRFERTNKGADLGKLAAKATA